MNVLIPSDNVTILYGHIHRHRFQQSRKVKHYAARSLIFALNDPTTSDNKKPLPVDKDDPFKELGIPLRGAVRRRRFSRSPLRS
jgi:hypothetical protein